MMKFNAMRSISRAKQDLKMYTLNWNKWRVFFFPADKCILFQFICSLVERLRQAHLMCTLYFYEKGI